ncbi:MAG: sensor histidine kinase [Desulfovibrionales bacterium]|nr:sensor histidine kinase [Desulfovibrionales bacterium]
MNTNTKYTGWGAESEDAKGKRYARLHWNIVLSMAAVAIIPLFLMAVVNFHLYKTSLSREVEAPLKSFVSRTKHSFELYLHERLSAVSFIAAGYSREDLVDERQLNHIFQIAKNKFEGLVDLGVIDGNGKQVAYAGPYNLRGKDYSEQPWFHETRIRGSFISNVFMGYRNVPHLAIAVEERNPLGQSWILRATINTEQLEELITLMNVSPDGDAFIISPSGVLQTHSNLFGPVLASMPPPYPPRTFEPVVTDMTGPDETQFLIASSYVTHPELILIAARPVSALSGAWYTLRGDLLLIFVGGIVVIAVATYFLTRILIKRIKIADASREKAFREIEHTHKLSSVGRLAAGVAHEINNPLAIINEKAGLMKDLLSMKQAQECSDRLVGLLDGITNSVARCRTITHRLLGFARRMDVTIEDISVLDVVNEVLAFLEKEAVKHAITVEIDTPEKLPTVRSDRGQLQQVFLNILSNAYEAVEDRGTVWISVQEREHGVVVVIRDNGQGMPLHVQHHIFEPFFSTKKSKGTGLGLAITYGIISKLGGNIAVESAEGKGSTFTVFIPWDGTSGKESEKCA